MQKQAKKHYTPEEYLALEETAEERSEYYRGEIFAMGGGTANHNRIAGNTYSSLNSALKDKKCEAFISDMRVWIKTHELFTYPDIFVVCGKPEFYEGRKDTVLNPLVIFEVLSNSTKNYDRGEKFLFYRSIPTLKEYILIDQYQIHIEHFSKQESRKWVLADYNDLNGALSLPEIGFQISVKEIYDKVEFGEE